MIGSWEYNQGWYQVRLMYSWNPFLLAARHQQSNLGGNVVKLAGSFQAQCDRWHSLRSHWGCSKVSYSALVAKKRGRLVYPRFVKSFLSRTLSLLPRRVYDAVMLASRAYPIDDTYTINELSVEKCLKSGQVLISYLCFWP